MFGPWYETDDDCCQHMRKNGKTYEMIQAVWLDTTEADIKQGRHEYVIVNATIDLDDVTIDEVMCALAAYGYSIGGLIEEYGYESAIDLIAECVLEEEILRDCYAIDDADSFEEAKEKIEKHIQKTEVSENAVLCESV